MAEIFSLYRLHRQRRDEIQRTWRLRDRDKSFELEDSKFIQKFRLSKAATLGLCREIETKLNVAANGYSVEMQLLNVLRMMATGSFQNIAADGFLAQLSQPTSSRNMDKLLDVLLELRHKYILFPSDDGFARIAHKFFQKTKFPNVVGALDCTHIMIKKPISDDVYSFINRKGRYSINVQMVCDANLSIMNVVARWPGSTHDSFIWHNSLLRHRLSSSHRTGDAYLLGDCGYPLEPWLITPYVVPCSPQEDTFNKVHAKARSAIERCFGMLKSRFGIIDSEGKLLYNSEKCCKIIMAAAILHNICVKYNVPDVEVMQDRTDRNEYDASDTPVRNVSDASDATIRDHLALSFQMMR